MFKKPNSNFVIKIISALILTLLFYGSCFFDTAGPPRAFAADNIFTDNIGIATTAPLGLLQVGTSPNVPLVVKADGKVGIGTTGPGYTLDVNGIINAATALRIGTNPAASGVIRIPNNQSIVGRNAANNGDVNLVSVNTSDQLILRGVLGVDSSTNIWRGTDKTGAISIWGGWDGNDAALFYVYGGDHAANPGWAQIYTPNAAGNAPVERLRITGVADTANVAFLNSNVGIGTTSPTAGLTVGTGTNNNAQQTNSVYVTGNLEVDGSSWLGDAAADTLSVVGTLSAANASMTLKTLTVTEGTYLATTSGNVGIGTTAPAAKLDVIGSAKFGDSTDLWSYADFQHYKGWSNPGSGTYYNFVVLPGYTSGVDSSGANLNGIVSYPRLWGSSNVGSYTGMMINPWVNQTGGTISSEHGLQVANNYDNQSGTATITDSYGIKISSWKSNVAGSTVSINNKYGLKIDDPWASGGTFNIASNYGLYVSELTKGTSNYAVYTAGSTKSYFGGNVGIGTTLPNYALEVASTGYFGGDLKVGTGTFNNTSGAADAYVTGNLEVDGSAWLGDAAADTLTVSGTLSAANSSMTLKSLTVTDAAYLATTTGNVGIGTTNPGAALAVGNDAFKVTSAGIVTAGTWQGTAITDTYVSDTLTSSIFVGTGSTTNAVDLATSEVSGTLAVGNGGTGATTLTGVLKGNGASAVSAMTGTANYAARWTDANTLGTGILYDNATNVGIGTTSPVGLLHVGSQSVAPLYVASSTGNVGIGTTGPTSKLTLFNDGEQLGTSSYYRIANFNASRAGVGTGIVIDNSASTSGTGVIFTNGNNKGSMIRMASDGSIAFDVGGNASMAGITLSAMHITSAGNVGIGTTAPYEQLDLTGKIRQGGTSAWYAGHYIEYTDGGTGTLNFRGGRDAQTWNWQSGVTWGTKTAASLYTADGSDNTHLDLYVASDQVNPKLVLSASGNSYFNSTGNVGIGTTGPLQKLHVTGNIRLPGSNPTFLEFHDGANQHGYVGTIAGDASGVGLYLNSTVSDRDLGLSAASGKNIRFFIGGTGGEKVRIDNNGNVGIGTTLPNYALEVASTGYFGGDLKVGTGTFNNTSGAADAYVTGNLEVDGSAWLGDAAADTLTVSGTLSAANSSMTLKSLTVTDAAYLATTTGNVGIGTTSPVGLLHVGSQSVAPLYVASSTGNVGIGTTGPSHPLDVVGSIATYGGYFRARRTGSGLIDPDAGNLGDIELKPAGSLAMLLRANGNVGIGTTAPTSKLTLFNDGEQLGTSSYYRIANFNASRAGVGTGIVIDNSASTSGTGVIFTNGNNKGSMIRMASDGSIAFDVGGNASMAGITLSAMHITSGGNVGIGTTNPGTYKLYVNGDTYIGGVTVTGGTLSFGGDLNMNSKRIYNIGTSNVSFAAAGALDMANQLITNIGNANTDFTSGGGLVLAGNVGIGTTNTTETLYVAGAGSIYVTNTNGLAMVGTPIRMWSNTPIRIEGTATPSNYVFQGSSGTAYEEVARVSSPGGGAGTARFELKQGSLSGNFDAANNLITNIGNANTDFVTGGGLNLAGNLAVNTDKLFVNATTGNVGIGTTNPLEVLEIYKSGIAASNLRIRSDAVSGVDYNGSLYFSTDGQNPANVAAVRMKDTNDSYGFEFWTHNGSTLTPKMSILGGGNVGIGTTGPGAKLDVSGTANVTGGIINTATNILDQSSSGLAASQPIRWIANESGYIWGVQNNSTAGDAMGIIAKIAGTSTQRILTLNSNGTDRFVVQGSGNVGIGTTNPQYKLDVNGTLNATTITQAGTGLIDGTGTANYIPKWSDSNTLTGTSLVYDNGTNVGIGTTSPQYKLDVKGTSYFGGLMQLDGNSIGGVVELYSQNAAGSALYISGDRSGIGDAVTLRTRNSANSPTPRITIGGYVDTAEIDIANATLDLNGNNIYSSSGNLNLNDQVYVSGNAGIGTTGPSGKLEIAEDGVLAATDGNVVIQHPTSNSYSTIVFPSRLNAGSDYGYIAYYDDNNSYAYWGDSAENSALVIGTQNDGNGTFSDVVVLKPSASTIVDSQMIVNGNVGIGTTNPLSKLEISGGNLDLNTNNLIVDSGGDKTISAAELSYLDTVSSNIQTQLNGKQATITGAATTITSSDLTASRALVSDTGGKVAASSITSTELGYLSGVSNNIQTQLNGKLTSTGTLTGLVQSTLAGTSYFTGGNVGIGTTAPTSKLTLFNDGEQLGTSSYYRIANFNASRAGVGTGIVIDNSASTSGTGVIFTNGNNKGSMIRMASDGSIAFDVGGNASMAGMTLSAMHITSGGNVGIGTTAPAYAFHNKAGSGVIATEGSEPQLRIISAATTWAIGENTGAQGTGKLSFGYGVTDANYLNWTTGGNLGVGTKTPVAKLHLVGTGTTTGINFLSTGAGGGGGLVGILDNGNVGIGTTNPAAPLDILAGVNPLLILGGTTAAGNASAIRFNYNNGTFGGYVGIESSGGGSLITGATARTLAIRGESGVAIGGGNRQDLYINTSGNVGIGTTSPGEKLEIYNGNLKFMGSVNGDTRMIHSYYDAGELLMKSGTTSDQITSINLGARGHASRSGIQFSTRGQENMRIADGGNVGIGTTAPSNLLYIAGSTPDGTHLVAIANTTLSGDFIKMINSSGNPVIQLNQGSTGAGLLRLFDGTTETINLNSATSANIWFNTGGNVGIGTTTPAQKLDVNGNVTAAVYYDRDNASYYVDPSGTSNLNTIGGHAVSGTLNMSNQAISNVFALEGFLNSPLRLKSIGTGAIMLNDNTSTTGPFAWYGGGGTALVTFTNTGNVGIGTTGPNAKLEIGGNPNQAIRTAYLDISGNNAITADRPYIRGLADHFVLAPRSGASLANTMYLAYPGDLGAGSTVNTRIQETLYISSTGSGGGGNVGIGTATPNSKLDVNGGFLQIYDLGSDPVGTDCDAAAEYGRMYVETGTNRGLMVCLDNGWYTIRPGTNDIAEYFPTNDSSLEPGDIVSADPENKEYVVKSPQLYDDKLIGIVSTHPFVIGKTIENGKLVALAGRVPVKVSLENGPINVGDRLTSSSTPGVAMKATKAGLVVGIALERFDGSHPTISGALPYAISKVIAFVNVSWYGGTATIAPNNVVIGANLEDTFTATVATGTRNFEINHPTKPGIKLIHSTLEGPEIAVFYRGQAKLINGEAIVELPDYFEALTRRENRTIQLTPKGTQPYLLSATEVLDGKFKVYGTKPEGEFFWEVKAVRADIEPLRVEKLKERAEG